MSSTLITIPESQSRSVFAAQASVIRQRILRALLFVWTLLIACPIRYWAIDDYSFDSTWVFALNYGAAHGLALGRDLIWTTGPLGYLVFPMDIGNNLAKGLLFQGLVWSVLIGIFADLFFRAGLSLRNLSYFTIFFSLSAPLYWFNYMGVENLLLAGALVLLIVSRERDGLWRYIAALSLAGVIPLIKLTGGLLIGGAVLGFLIFRAYYRRRKVWYEVILACVVPVGVATAACWFLLPSLDAFLQYIRGSIEVVEGYSAAASLAGDRMEFAGVAETLVGFGMFLFFRTKENRPTAWFLLSLLGVPLLISIKHGFVRQDVHVLNFYCFAGLALALAALIFPLTGKRLIVAFLVLVNFGILSLEYTYVNLDFKPAMAESSGVRGATLAMDALHFANMRASLRPHTSPLEPEIRAIVADSPVASLSVVYSGAARDGLNLRLYPIIQRYSAWTPYLDGRNAVWIRDQGPRFLLFDGGAIDNRHPWAETPTMWLEIYRWYDTRLLGKRNLLLERRARPRFERLVPMAHFQAQFANGFAIPSSETPVFWTLDCPLSGVGVFEKLFFRVPEVRMIPDGGRAWRILPEVLTSPVMGNSLPDNLAEFAALMRPAAPHKLPVRRITFDGPGLAAYAATCQGNFLVPAR